MGLAKNRPGPGRGKAGSPAAPALSSAPPTLAAAGIDKKLSSRAQKFEGYIREAVASGKELTSSGVRKLASAEKKEQRKESEQKASGISFAQLEDLVASGHRFGTIYADPPWVYSNQGTRAATSNHYGGLAVDELCALPVVKLAADDAFLHLWTTNAFMFDCKRIMEAWGFEYRSCFVWVKPQMGIGNYWRVSHEFLLLGRRGSPKWMDHSTKSWGQFDRTKHSAKPEEIRKLIERACPGPYIEMFGRRPVEGWVVWGNGIEAGLFDQAVKNVA